LFKIVGGKALADRDSKDVDHFIRMRADEMGTEDATAVRTSAMAARTSQMGGFC
jgi:hypothetical protein